VERGFIQTEVISYDDLVKCNSLSEARKKGLLQLEGKNYTVQDGDIITFLKNKIDSASRTRTYTLAVNSQPVEGIGIIVFSPITGDYA
jgi:hypothetical protein